MVNYATELRRLVIRPTLEELDVQEAAAVDCLAACALLTGQFGEEDGAGLGLYRITPAQHRRVWDGYLAFRPELASTVRGMASQHQFLQDPDRELATNLAYASAIAWLLIQISGLALPASDDIEGLVRLWQRVFAARPAAAAETRRACDWLRQQPLAA